ncbi:NAD(P)/FAD-dependent oxidoreductase [uncultured Dokdonia sp.]|uniref:NAD(P)/FAD-dependent oxidoreductase n=1 Tax=uncultured Dokdonia sp. TaxID=575653 RepID=UPI0026327D0A|nr:NAD(P)/FAD-dependent oxidoreductase [uncultured Dokdonia sp.]
MNHKQITVLIVGGGLAGLTSAIHMAKENIKVILIEKNTYPKHKVCGEYVSNEVLFYLESLGIYPYKYQARKIEKFQFSSLSGNTLDITLPLGGFGISRFALDALMMQRALELGVEVVQATVTAIQFESNLFQVRTNKQQEYIVDYVLGAHGKRSNLDNTLSRKFIKKKSAWLGVKAHYKSDFPDDVVALHNFNGGYCGLSKVETGDVNACYLADYASFKKYKNITQYQETVLYKNKALKTFFENSQMTFEAPIAISQISFDKKEPVYNHIFMVGDSAGLIHPLCGNGMAMAIHSAKIIASLLTAQKTSTYDRLELEQQYTLQWNRAFQKRLRVGRFIQNTLQNKKITRMGVSIVSTSPYLLKTIIKATHGTSLV